MSGYLYARIKNKCNPFQLRVLGTSLVIAILVFISPSSSLFPPAAQGDCGECPDPLVEMRNLRMGDISTIADLFKELAKKYYGWEGEEESVQEIVTTGFNFLEFKKENPCAEMYYTEMRWTGEKEEEIRHGAKEGTAKYYIQSTLNMVRAQPGERALVTHAIYDEKGHEISVQEDFVPKMGTVHVHHELICLKNNETYDEGDLRLDWLPDPPANEGYFYSEKGADGIIVGLFNKGSIAGMPIELSQGDVGRTIRNKETPSSFSLDVEEEHLYPPYYELKIDTIRNLLGEALPNKIFVALRTKFGEIEGGMKTQGWSVFPTEAGKIETPVFYRVPECPQTNEDVLEMAAFCDWHAGEPMIGKPQASQKIHIPECFKLSLFLSNKDYSFHEEETKVDIPEAAGYSVRGKETSESCFEATLFVTFKKEPKSIRALSKDIFRYVYEVESWKVGSQNIYYRGQRDWVETTNFGTNYENHRRSSRHSFIQKVNLLGHGELVFNYDRKNEKITEVTEIPGFDVYVRSIWHRQSKTYLPEKGWTSEDRTEEEEEYLGFIGQSIKTERISGDGKTSLIGSAQKEKITQPHPCLGDNDPFRMCSEKTLKSMRWELRKR